MAHQLDGKRVLVTQLAKPRSYLPMNLQGRIENPSRKRIQLGARLLYLLAASRRGALAILFHAPPSER